MIPRPELTHFRLDVGDDGVATVLLDVPGAALNTLSLALVDDLASLMAALEEDEAIRAVVLGSAKEGFLAGADLNWLRSLTSSEEAAEASRQGQDALARLEALHAERGKPVVAAINGACLAGGLELVLACSHRLVVDDPSAVLGQSEVRVGLIPGAGGTQRLPRLVGLATGLDLILTGRSVRPRQALRLGLVDEVVPAPVLHEVARLRAREAAEGGGGSGRRPPLPDAARELLLERNALGRRLVYEKARRDVFEKTQGNYPAPEAALEAVRTGVEEGQEAGYRVETEHFARLVVSPEARALIGIFFATRELEKETGVEEDAVPRPVSKVGVLGGGLMGAGIATVTLREAGTPVRVKEVDDEGLLHAFRYVRRALDRDVERGRRTAPEAERLRHRLTGTLEYRGFGDADLVIEAVFEDLDLKRRVLAEAEAVMRADAVFASNTSSIPIARIAERARHPERVIGMHYFSPAERMPLLEVVRPPGAAGWAVATGVDFGKRQGKTVIVVGDGPGFYTSRILAPYMNEAVRLVAEGASIEAVDGAMTRFGFPVGPLRLLDEIGIDVGAKVAGVLEDALGERLTAPPGMEKVLADGRKGRKAGRGFYRYDGGRRRGPDHDVHRLLRQEEPAERPPDDLRDRLVLAMVNEAALCLQDQVLRSPRDGDVGAVFGLGFPAYTGGPFSYLDRRGVGAVAATLEELAGRHGSRFRPASILSEHANGRFRP